MVAAGEGHLASVQMLLDAKADSSITDFTGRTAYDWAERNKRRAVIRFFKTSGIGS
jgi:ankyrin repeat protein